MGERNGNIMFTNINTTHIANTTFTWKEKNYRWETVDNREGIRTYFYDGDTTLFLNVEVPFTMNEAAMNENINFIRKFGQTYKK